MWIKIDDTRIDNYKYSSLSLEEKGMLNDLICLANKGENGFERGQIPGDIDVLIYRLRYGTEKTKKTNVQNVFSNLIKKNFIDVVENNFYIHDFFDYQQSDSAYQKQRYRAQNDDIIDGQKRQMSKMSKMSTDKIRRDKIRIDKSSSTTCLVNNNITDESSAKTTGSKFLAALGKKINEVDWDNPEELSKIKNPLTVYLAYCKQTYPQHADVVLENKWFSNGHNLDVCEMVQVMSEKCQAIYADSGDMGLGKIAGLSYFKPIFNEKLGCKL